MVMEGLGKSLRNVLSRIGSASSVDDELIKDICKDLQRALLEADGVPFLPDGRVDLSQCAWCGP